MDPEISLMRHRLQRRYVLAVLLPFAGALMGWAVGRRGSRPLWTPPNPQVLSAPTRPEVAVWTGGPSPVSDSRGSVAIRASGDPFDEGAPGRSVGSADPWMGFDSLRLGAIWCQPGDPLAVIGGRVVRPGDVLGGFQLAYCGVDAVWITGPEGSRRLGLQPRPDPKPVKPRS